jgi:hypothetical protein
MFHGAALCLRGRQLCSYLRSSPNFMQPEIYHSLHKIPPLVPIPSQISLGHATSSFISKSHFNIIHPPTSYSLLLTFTQINYIFLFSLPFMLRILSISPSSTSLFQLYLAKSRSYEALTFCSFSQLTLTSSLKQTNKLHGLSPRANYTDRATAASRRSNCQLLRIKGAKWSA